MPNDPSSLLATLAQSSAAIVAIVGGFLVSRLVALSSEREGLRRQLVQARDRLQRVTAEYDKAHDYRLENSKLDFFDWMIESVVKSGEDIDWDALLADNIPRGSSEDEMRPYLDEIKAQVSQLTDQVHQFIRQSDHSALRLSDLEERGLTFSKYDRGAMTYIVDNIAENLPEKRLSPYLPNLPFIRDSALMASDNTTTSRRLDESIKEEQDLHSQQAILQAETERLKHELEQIGRPTGVVSAILILALYSLLGIVAPVIVLACSPTKLSAAWIVLLVLMFLVGLFAVLGYIYWYAKTLNDPIDDSQLH